MEKPCGSFTSVWLSQPICVLDFGMPAPTTSMTSPHSRLFYEGGLPVGMEEHQALMVDKKAWLAISVLIDPNVVWWCWCQGFVWATQDLPQQTMSWWTQSRWNNNGSIELLKMSRNAKDFPSFELAQSMKNVLHQTSHLAQRSQEGNFILECAKIQATRLTDRAAWVVVLQKFLLFLNPSSFQLYHWPRDICKGRAFHKLTYC